MEKKDFDLFGTLVFNDDEMKKRLTSDVYERYQQLLSSSKMLDKPTADAIAKAMKEWALERGCTHYTHWFLPLTGTTAEKHESFLDKDKNGKSLIQFNGKTLIKGEPDASSFPSGGLRSTFEARGYTYWDVTSPAFVREKVLCIPSVFVSYYGESLDKKGPLLKSMALINEKATKLLHLLGYRDVKSVKPMVGLEQEYFLIDRPLYKERLDLVLTGRTLFGHAAAKGQEFEDHYFGAIPTRVQDFMKEVNQELWKLGIYAKTEHNEVAPRQFELAPLFADCNIAVDQNQIIMDILRRVAYRHGFACLLHEKPFDGINGSGKHNNYSLVTDTGMNLFDPGKGVDDTEKFSLFTACLIKAIDTYPELLRIAAANPGNDFRLGCNEAPPAIISIFLGDYIENLIGSYCGLKKKSTLRKSNQIEGFAYINTDNTDRNRTSPVAFTGNKFEFRMLGSSASAAMPNVVLNTILASTIDEVIHLLNKTEKKNYDVVIKDYIRKVLKKHHKVIYGKNGYSQEWIDEAASRGLPNIASTVEAISLFDEPKNVKLLTSYQIYSAEEIAARKEVWLDQYISSICLEVKTLLHMSESYIIPALVKEIANYKAIAEDSIFAGKRKEYLAGLLDELASKMDKMKTRYADIMMIDASLEKAFALRQEIVSALADVRKTIDLYEKIASKAVYTLPTYSTMLY